MKRSALLILILMSVVVSSAQASDIFEKVGTFAGQFLKLGPSARGAAMGNAFTAIADDPSATYWNPAGLVEVPGTAVHIDHMEWPADIKLDYVSYVFKTGWIPGTMGLTARGLTMDPQVERTIYLPDGTGREFDAGDMSFGFSYAQFFTDRFSTGFTFNLIHMTLADRKVNTGTLDFGLLYRIGIRGMRLGMVVQNMGGEVDFDSRPSKLPILFKVGLSAMVFDFGPHYMIGSLEFQHPADNKERANVGFEYSFNRFFFLRGGYNAGYDTNKLSAGFGVEVNTSENSRMIVDYAYEDLSELGGAHRFSMSFIY